MPYVVTSACNQCGACIAGCENDAITEGETQSHIDPDKCIECGTCEANCPFQAIIFAQDDGAEGQTAQSEEEAKRV
jgi:ferredoxin